MHNIPFTKYIYIKNNNESFQWIERKSKDIFIGFTFYFMLYAMSNDTRRVIFSQKFKFINTFFGYFIYPHISSTKELKYLNAFHTIFKLQRD